MKKCNRTVGFTLLELLVVLLLISLLTAFIVPNLVKSLGRMNAETTVREISALLRYARSRAITQNTPYVAVFDLSADKLTVAPLGMSQETEDSAVNPMRMATKVYHPPEGIHFQESVAFDGLTPQAGFFGVHFFPGGGSSGGKVTIVDDEKRRFGLTFDMITGSVKINQHDKSDS